MMHSYKILIELIDKSRKLSRVLDISINKTESSRQISFLISKSFFFVQSMEDEPGPKPVIIQCDSISLLYQLNTLEAQLIDFDSKILTRNLSRIPVQT